LALLLAGCKAQANPTAVPAGDDPSLDLNVTPEPEASYGYFTIDVKRIGKQAPSIGWFAQGQIYIRVLMDLGQPDNPSDSMMLTGNGFGKAGFDASGGPCVDLGGWPTEYTVVGFFEVPKCQLNVTIEEIWPATEARATCMGYSGSSSGGPYKLTFKNLKFTASQTRVDSETNQDMIQWMNTFRLTPGEGLEDSGCEFAPAP
jgi:hypothetical protein